MNEKTYTFYQAVRDCLVKAFKMYNITEIDPDDIRIDPYQKGMGAGKAGYKTRGGEREYYLTFSQQAINEHYDEMVNSTIPHEVAHLVCYMRPHLGKNHNAGWKRVAIALGDINRGDTTHTMDLDRAKPKVEYLYRLECGKEFKLGPKRNAKLQKGKARAYIFSNTHHVTRKHLVCKLHDGVPESRRFLTPTAAVAKPAHSTKATSSTKLSKREQAEALYVALTHRGESRTQIISAFMSQINMTKAGASTYYYNCQKKFK